MKRISYIIFASLMVLGMTSCEDYLEVESPSSADEDFVFTSPDETFKVIAGCYDLYRDAQPMLYNISMVGSDTECHPEAYSNQARHIAEGLFATDGSIDMADYITQWQKYYRIANRANIVIEKIEANEEFKSDWAKGVASKWTHLYGEVITMRAIAYHELSRFYGDVPHFKTPIKSAEVSDTASCTSRDEIYDYQISELIRVEPMMYRLGEGGIQAERFSRTFVQGLIGRIALWEGGYTLRRVDFNYGKVTFEANDFTTKWDAKYMRRSDYKKYYEIAKTYLEACISNSGTAHLLTSDDRGYNNPFQRHFQYMMDLSISPEALYEIGCTQGTLSEFGYAFGRPSDGGSSNAYTCKAYGQSRIYASFYYGEFDPSDLRRDVTVAVTANSGSCVEKIISFAPGSKSSGGLANNKWDESRMTNPYTSSQRNSGINIPIMRMADVVLMLAEVYAELGDEGSAKTQLKKIRSRAFSSADQTDKVENYINSLSGETLKEAIAQERKYEFAGEGLRRWDLIRTGKLPEKIVALRSSQREMYNGLKTNGYYTFSNGNTISNYIYTKGVNTNDLGMKYMLTKQCDVSKNDATYPVKFPSWRGQHDGWSNYTNTSGSRNLAIQGIMEYIDPAGQLAKDLVSAGYKKTDWGSKIISNESQYVLDIFKGYPDEYYQAKYPPRYILPLSSETISKSNQHISNGYGFSQN